MKRIFLFFNRMPILLHNLYSVYTDPNRKDLLSMIWEFILCSVHNRCIAIHYLTCFIYRKGIVNIYDYLPEKEAYRVQDQINDPKYSDIISNKLSFLEHFERVSIPVPMLLGYNILDKLYLRTDQNWKAFEITHKDIFKDTLVSFLQSYDKESVFIKQIRGCEGKGAYKISINELNNPENLRRIYNSVKSDYYVFQSVINQHPELSELNPSSLNTVRIDTFKPQRGNAEILSAFIRVGSKGNFVDNIASGGVYTGIHLDTGILKKEALTIFHGSNDVLGLGPFKSSPATGILFDGFKVPHFNNVKETVIKAANLGPQSLIGWDIAVSESGPVLIEANILYYGLMSSDTAYGGYRKNLVYKKIKNYINQNNL